MGTHLFGSPYLADYVSLSHIFIGVAAGKFSDVWRIFARISPNLPEKLLGNFFANIFSQQQYKDHEDLILRLTSKKGLAHTLAPFIQIKQYWAPFLPVFSGSSPRFSRILRRFSQIPPRFLQFLLGFSRILPGFSTNQNFWGWAPCNPASYTTAHIPRPIL